MRAVALAVLVSLTGCQWDPYTSVYTGKQPKPEDLVGMYVPDEATAHFIAAHYSASEVSIVLSADGTINLHNIPDCWETPFGETEGGFDSGTGRWTIQKHQEWWVLGVNIWTDGFSSRGHAHINLTTEIFLVGEKPPYIIHLTIGDPDAGNALQFIRKT
jgi:hypothetical protein